MRVKGCGWLLCGVIEAVVARRMGLQVGVGSEVVSSDCWIFCARIRGGGMPLWSGQE